ncbi:MAG TPA: FAD-dependent oxidoreductase [Vicinamibacteria bacterium]|nr:FAD-dependent oxidoreductase [Vicinamibacteria bacterium]
MARRRIVVVGGAFSGAVAAARARELDEGAEVLLLERGPEVSYGIGGLAHLLSGEIEGPGALNRENVRFFRDVYNVDVRTGVEVRSIDAKAHELELDDGPLRYDRLVVATGVRSPVPAIEGLEGATNVFRFRRLSDLEGILRILKRGTNRVVILGGGYFGLEAADGFLRRGCQVTVVEKSERILGSYSPATSARVREVLNAQGASVVEGQPVTRVSTENRRVTELLFNGQGSVPADLVVVCTGVEPRTELLRKAGARLLRDGSVKVNRRMATSLQDVFACGVCVSSKHAVTGKRVWLPQASVADRSGQVAGANAAGHDQKMAPVLGTAILRIGELTVGRTGWTANGKKTAVTRVHGFDRDPYFPGANEITMEIFYKPGSGRIVGAEAFGGAGTDKRIDVLATAILGKLDVEALAGLDLAYAAPYAMARDVTNVSGQVAAWSRERTARAWTPAEIEKEKPVVIDVGSTAEKGRGGPIRAQRRIPLEKLRERMSEVRSLARSRPVVFLCGTGRKGYLAARIARGSGLKSAGYLSGGVASWPA